MQGLGFDLLSAQLGAGVIKIEQNLALVQLPDKQY